MPAIRPPLPKIENTVIIDSPIQSQETSTKIFLSQELEREKLNRSIPIKPSDEWKEPEKGVLTARMRKYFINNDLGEEYVVDKEYVGKVKNTENVKVSLFKITLLNSKGENRTMDVMDFKDSEEVLVKIIDMDKKMLVKTVGKTRRRTLSADGRRMEEGVLVPMTITKQDITYTILTPSNQTFKVKENVLNI